VRSYICELQEVLGLEVRSRLYKTKYTYMPHLTQGAMSSTEYPLKVLDLLPFLRQRAASQFRKTSHGVYAQLSRDGFVVLEVPTADKQQLSKCHQSLMSYRCKTTFEGAFLSARHLPRRHVLEFNAGSTEVLVVQELPPGDDGWTQTCQTEAFEAMHTLKTTTVSVLDAVSFSMCYGLDSARLHLLEDEVPDRNAMISSSALQVISYAPAEAMQIASQEQGKDVGLLTAMYCPTPGLQVKVPEEPATPHKPAKPEQWLDVPHGDNIVVVMIGYTLEYATGGVFRAPVYRVQPSTSMPGHTSLAFKLRARSTATLPRGLMLVGQRNPPDSKTTIEVSALIQTFRQTYGPSLNGSPTVSAADEKLQVRCRQYAEVRGSSQVLFKTLSGETVVLAFETLQCPVVVLMQRLEQRVGMLMDKMRLICRGSQLESHKIAAEQGVEKECTIHVTMRMCGD
jgi:hypothetical protein